MVNLYIYIMSIVPPINFDETDYDMNTEGLIFNDPLNKINNKVSIKEANISNNGIITATTQTIGGVKTFNNTPKNAGIPSDPHHLVNKTYVDEIAQKGRHWKQPVISITDVNDITETDNGDRYIQSVETEDFKKDYIYEYSTAQSGFIEIQPHEGDTLYVKSDDSTFNDSLIIYTIIDNVGQWIQCGQSFDQSLNTNNNVEFNNIVVEDKGEDHTQSRVSIKAPGGKQLDMTVSDTTDVRIEPAPLSGINNLTIGNAHREFALTSGTMSMNAPLTITSNAMDPSPLIVKASTGQNIIECKQDRSVDINQLKLTASSSSVTHINNSVNVTPNDTSLLTEKAITDYVGANATKDHSALSNLAIGDPHTQYATVTGRANETITPHAITTHSLKFSDSNQTILRVKTAVDTVSIDNDSLLTEQGMVRYNDNTNKLIGFVNRAHCGIHIINGIFYIEPHTVSTFTYYSKISGVHQAFTKAGVESIAVNQGHNLIHYNGNTLSNVSTFDTELIKDYALIAYVYRYNDNIVIFSDERHGIGMSSDTHYHLHKTVGSRLISGGTPLPVIGATGDISITAGKLLDEDLEHIVKGKEIIDNVKNLYLIEDGKWTFQMRKYINPGSLASRNHFDGTNWQLYVITDSRYVLGHIIATNSLFGNDSRENNGNVSYMGICGQAEYQNLNAARAGAIDEIKGLYLVGFPIPEFVFIATVIYFRQGSSFQVQTVDNAGNLFIDWRDKTFNATGMTPTSHSALTNLSSDDHTQYAMVNGRANQTLIAHSITQDNGSHTTSITSSSAGGSIISSNNAKMTIRNTSSTNNIILDNTGSVNTVSLNGLTKVKDTTTGATSSKLIIASPNKQFDITASDNSVNMTPGTLQEFTSLNITNGTRQVSLLSNNATLNCPLNITSSNGDQSPLLVKDGQDRNVIECKQDQNVIVPNLTANSVIATNLQNKWTTLAGSTTIQMTATTGQKIYYNTAGPHTLILPYATASLEGFEWTILLGPDVHYMEIRIGRSEFDNKPLSIGGINIVLYPNQRVKFELLSATHDNGYGLWLASYYRELYTYPVFRQVYCHTTTTQSIPASVDTNVHYGSVNYIGTTASTSPLIVLPEGNNNRFRNISGHNLTLFIRLQSMFTSSNRGRAVSWATIGPNFWQNRICVNVDSDQGRSDTEAFQMTSFDIIQLGANQDIYVWIWTPLTRTLATSISGVDPAGRIQLTIL